MARKTFCDGCGDEVMSAPTVVKIGFMGMPGVQVIKTEEFDLCSGCLAQFRHHYLPNKWPRMGKPEGQP